MSLKMISNLVYGVGMIPGGRVLTNLNYVVSVISTYYAILVKIIEMQTRTTEGEANPNTPLLYRGEIIENTATKKNPLTKFNTLP